MAERRWTFRDAFAEFGAKATNPRQTWSARNDRDKIVVLSLWEDGFDPAPGSKYSSFDQPSLPHWQNSRGNKDRIKNLKFAREHCDGLFRVVVVTAKDRDVIPRSALKLYQHPTRIMRLTKLNEETGEFSAVSVES